MADEALKIPTHVSIIMDGNGRWAQERGRERVFGHQNGAESVRAVTEESVAQGVKYLSLYAFSEENWNRPKEEVEYLMKLLFRYVSDELENCMKNGVRVRFLGNRSRLDPFINDAVTGLEQQTAGNDRMTLIIFISYSGKWDILQAAKRFAADAARNPALLESEDMDAFSHYLVTDGIPDPDLIIRTSGEQRISNYLLWQGAYAEFYFTPTLWPDFRKEEYRQALREYSSRDRRFGKVK